MQSNHAQKLTRQCQHHYQRTICQHQYQHTKHYDRSTMCSGSQGKFAIQRKHESQQSTRAHFLIYYVRIAMNGQHELRMYATAAAALATATATPASSTHTHTCTFQSRPIFVPVFGNEYYVFSSVLYSALLHNTSHTWLFSAVDLGTSTPVRFGRMQCAICMRWYFSLVFVFFFRLLVLVLCFVLFTKYTGIRFTAPIGCHANATVTSG